MKLNKKVTDFIRLEEGNIGRKAAVVTGALLASGVLGAVLTAQVAEAHTCPPDPDPLYHVDNWVHSDAPHSDHYNHHVDICYA